MPPVASGFPSRLVLIGHPVAHSLSPVFQNAALEHLGIPLRYEALDVPPEQLADLLPHLAREGAAGNVTIPHKMAVARQAQCTPLARRVGAVNTFWHESGVLYGDNTDVVGVIAALAQLRPQATSAPRRCTVLGAGGSAAAVLVALDRIGCPEIRVAARDAARGRAVLNAVGVDGTVVPFRAEALSDVELVINATSVGLTDEREPLPVEALPAGAAVLDLVYRPAETAWVRHARTAGHPAGDGRTMLLEQGAAAFARWFHRAAPKEVMRTALDAACAQAASAMEPTAAGADHS